MRACFKIVLFTYCGTTLTSSKLIDILMMWLIVALTSKQ